MVSPDESLRPSAQAIDELNELMGALEDGAEELEEAAENINDRGLRGFLEAFAATLGDFGAELGNAVAAMGGKPEPGEGLGLREAWIELRAALSGNDTRAMAAEAERSVQRVLGEYEDVLEQQLTPGSREVVSRQYNEIQRMLESIRAMREGAED